MVNQTRNILLLMLSKEKNKEKSDFYNYEILEQFTYKLEREEEELQDQLKVVEENKKILEEVKKEILKNNIYNKQREI